MDVLPESLTAVRERRRSVFPRRSSCEMRSSRAAPRGAAFRRRGDASNISIGARFYANFDCVILDPGLVEIGDDVFFGPGVHIYTATHPIDANERIKGPELAGPVRIGSRCWIGGRSIILPGVTIGEGSTVGAGSVVTSDVPPNVLAAGNPCRVVRTLR